MTNQTAIALGPIINLKERLENGDTARSVALAQRTFQRFHIHVQYLESIVNRENSHLLAEILHDLEEMQGRPTIDKPLFLELCDRLFSIV